nr:uncharacterized protein LOC113715980 [Coffea arabica]
MEEFNEAIFSCGLADVGFDGPQFTWTNGTVWQRLDRAIANSAWMDTFDVTKVSHLVRGRSDHAPLLIKCGMHKAHSSSFRFLNVWANHSSFMDVVRDAWQVPVQAGGMLGFHQRLSSVKHKLRCWSRQSFGDIFQTVQVAEETLRHCQEEFDAARDDSSRMQLREAQARYARALGVECEYWRQKSAIRWIQQGDANTKFFHSIVKQRRNANFVSRVRDGTGCWLEEEEDIRNSAVQYFEKLLTSDREDRATPSLDFPLPSITAADNMMFQQLPSLQEVKEVVFSMSKDSAPGPDGFGAGFYQECWSIIHRELLEAVQEFFKGAPQPRGFSSALIVLIPKVTGAAKWQEFRPISLCNQSSKIISKVLTNRLNLILPNLISSWQSGFVPGRSIADNILVAQELAQDIDRKLTCPNLMLKLDMEKAYDRVEWSFLIFMLRRFGFQEWGVDLLFRTLSNNWFSLLINGSSAGYFKSSRGVRQGDPLSPALFLLVAEFLGWGMHHLFCQDESRFYVSPGLRVPYLAFADDTLVFTRCSEGGLTSLKTFFDSYQAFSGQKINAHKSCFILSTRASSTHGSMVASTLHFQQQFLPFTYLGAPVFKGRTTCVLFDPLVAKVQARLSHWSSRLLSSGGKLVLLRHVLTSMPMYLLQVMDPPRAVLLRLGKLCNAFLWDKPAGTRGIHWTSWETICFPVAEGGLGFRSFADMCSAFACKLWWRLRKNESLWASFMHAKYVRGKHPIQVTVARPSPTWRRLEGIRRVAENHIRWCVGRGFVDLWYDRWLFEVPLADLVSIPDPPHMLLAEFFDDRGCNVEKLQQWVPAQLVHQIQDIQLFPEQQDRMVWVGSPTGEFATKAAWEVSRLKHNASMLDGFVWTRIVPLKISFFAWKVLRNLIPLETVLQRRGVPLASRCPCCLLEQESLVHLFVKGPVAREVWRSFCQRFGIIDPRFSSVSAMVLAWLTSTSLVSRDHIRTVVPIVILWFLWKARNKALFEGEIFEARRVVSAVDEFVKQLGATARLSAAHFRGDMGDPWIGRCTRPVKRKTAQAVSWSRPPWQHVKLNTDASVSNKRAYGGGLLRDSDGQLIFAYYKEFGELDVLLAESTSLLHGLQLCSDLAPGPLLVEVDSKSLVDLLNAGATSNWPLCNTLRRIRALLSSLSAAVSHIFREANASADALAGLRMPSELFCTSLPQLPRGVRARVCLDSREVSSLRWQPG